MAVNRKIAFIDLSNRKIRISSISREMRQNFLGGRGLGAYLFFSREKPGTAALEPDNNLVISAGLLAGTPGSAECPLHFYTRSPLSPGLLGFSGVSAFTAEMRWAGFDHLIITGKASSPVYLSLHHGNIEIRDASAFRGKPVPETQQLIREELGERKTRVMAIGSAGEKLVRFAGIFSGPDEKDNGAGIGAVFGSKNLKAIAAFGDMDIVLARPKEALNLQYTENPLPKIDSSFQGPEGPSILSPGYPGLIESMKETGVPQLFGLDMVQTANTVAWLVDLLEQYILTDKDTDGIDLSWDSPNSLLGLVHLIAERNGIGDNLANGAKTAAANMGDEATKRLLQIKGRLLSPEDDLSPEQALNYATSITGNEFGDIRPPADFFNLSDPEMNKIFEQPVTPPDGISPTDKAWKIYWYQIACMASDSLGRCNYTQSFPDFETWSHQLSLVTGIEMTPNTIWEAAERAVNLERLFNVKAGLTDQDDRLPENYYRLAKNSAGMTAEDFDTLLNTYYRYHGWDSSGIPSDDTLKKLGIDREPSDMV